MDDFKKHTRIKPDTNYRQNTELMVTLEKDYGIGYNNSGFLYKEYKSDLLTFNGYIRFKRTKAEHHSKYCESLVHEFNTIHKRVIEAVDTLSNKHSALNRKDIIRIVLKYLNGTNLTSSLYKKAEAEVEMLCLGRDETIFSGINDYPDVFPLARKRKRKIYAYLGQTNSGKTYNAMADIANASTSSYLAPLRLLALETFEYLNSQGIETSLITGEEQILKENAQCVSSTVECFNYEKPYDVVVIDEIQMIDDPDRGWAFIQALIGSNSEKVIVTGPEEYKEKLEAIAKYLGEEIEVTIFNRKSELKPLKKPISISKVQKNTAIVAFSRRAIYEIKKKLPKHLKASVIYGALGFEVRKMQAEKFINGETDVLITTDAIGLGLNLPIETIIFSTDRKFDGRSMGMVSHMLVKQIAGRAGRFGKYPIGYYGGFTQDISSYVNECMSTPLEVSLDNKLSVTPPSFYIESLLGKYKLSTILINWSSIERFRKDGMFNNAGMDNKISLSLWLEKHYPNDFLKYWQLINCPIDVEKDMDTFAHHVKAMMKDKIKLPEINHITSYTTQHLETIIKELTVLCWFSNQFQECCEDNLLPNLQELLQRVNIGLDARLNK